MPRLQCEKVACSTAPCVSIHYQTLHLFIPCGMIIPVVSEAGGAVTEWILLDLQGHVLPTDGVGSCDGLTIGHMVHRAGSKTAAVQIGNHRVSGTVVDLKKPLVLIKKRDSTAATPMVVGGEQHLPEARASVEYIIAGVVRRKFLFEDRPQPIIGTMAARRAEVN